MRYNVIEIFTSEEARWRGKPISDAVIGVLRDARIAARCIVSRGQAGYYERGEVVSTTIQVLSFNLPIKIEIILPEPELENILPQIVEIVTDGIVVVEEMRIYSHRSRYRLIPRQLLVRDIMVQPPVSVPLDASVSSLVRILLREEFNALPVIDDAGRPVGIITQGDLIKRADMPLRLGLLGELERGELDSFLAEAEALTAADVMTSPVVTVRDDQPVTDVVALMNKRNLKRLPVVDETGTLVGVVTRLDIFKAVVGRRSDEPEQARPDYVQWQGVPCVGDVMERETGTVSPDTSIDEVLRNLSARNVQRMAVVDEDGRLLGLVTDRNIIAALGHRPGGLLRSLVARLPLPWRRREQDEDITLQTTAGEIMTTDLVTVTEDATLEEAMNLMVKSALKRLPVVDTKGRYLGMISRAALLRMSA